MQSQNMVSTISNGQQHQAPIFDGDEELKASKFTSNVLTGKYNLTFAI